MRAMVAVDNVRNILGRLPSVTSLPSGPLLLAAGLLFLWMLHVVPDTIA